MERNTNFSVITFQCSKWMQVLQSWHGLQGKVMANGTAFTWHIYDCTYNQV